jgi:hypothetical protein
MFEARRKFNQQRGNARRRGIAWQLTFDEWRNIWLASGKWNQRGIHTGEYCMARPGDIGPYSVGNVRIVPVTQNHNEMTYQHTAAAKAKIGAYHKGNQRLVGKKLSAAHKQKISESNQGRVGGFEGKRHSVATKALKRKTWRNQYGSAK